MLFDYINNFYNFFIGLSLCILLNDFFERKYPNEFKNFRKLTNEKFINFSYNCIYYYSKCQIFFMNTKNKLILFIEANPILLRIRNNINNLNIYPNKYDNNIEYYDDYGFDIYNYIDNKFVNKLLFYKNSNHPINEISDIKFMLIEFKNGENIYKIDLKTDKFNYYLVGNKFTKNFFIFYIKTHLNKNHEFDNKCTLKIIDHDVNKIEIEFTDKNESILLEKNGYELKVTNHNEEKE